MVKVPSFKPKQGPTMFSEGHQLLGESTWGGDKLPLNVPEETTSSSSLCRHINCHCLLVFTKHALCVAWVRVIKVFHN